MIYLSTIVFGILFVFLFLLFRKIPADKTFLLYITSFPFVFLGYMFADLMAYELTQNYLAFTHSIGLGTIMLFYQLMSVNILATWSLALYLLMFTIIESYFFYSAYKLGNILVPEVMEELVSGKTKRERYYLGILLVIPMKLMLYFSVGSIWATLHFPQAIIVHLFLALMISIPVSMYVIIKTRSMFPLLIAWFVYDCFLILWL